MEIGKQIGGGPAEKASHQGAHCKAEGKLDIDLYEQAPPDFATKKKLTRELMQAWTDKYCLSTFLPFEPLPIGKSKKLHDDLCGVVPNRHLSPKAWLTE